MNKYMASLAMLTLLSGCSATKSPVDPYISRIEAPRPVFSMPPITTINARPDFSSEQPSSILANRSVYYPFDMDSVQEADKPLVQAHAMHLREHPKLKVRLEGNCDERGSNEYNLAIGQRRADGVAKLLLLGGVQANQISSVSFGEEKPKAMGSDEKSWAQNRRTDLNYQNFRLNRIEAPVASPSMR